MKVLVAIALVGFMWLDLTAQKATTIFLVRHAEKADQSRDPDLNLAGKARAHRLLELLGEADIRAVYSTDYKRTQQTVAPIADKRGLNIISYRPFDEGMIEDLCTKHEGQNIVVAGHSNTIPDLVNKLIGEQKYEQLDDSDYSNIFVVTLFENNVSHYLLTY